MSSLNVGHIFMYDAAKLIRENINYPYLAKSGRIIIGTTKDGSPAVLGIGENVFGWIGYVHDMYYGASELSLRQQDWNVVWVARSLDEYLSKCRIYSDFPLDGCEASESKFSIRKDL